MNQKTAKVTYRKTGELNNGDIAQCPCCRKKFVVLPGIIRYGVDTHVVYCPECGLPSPLSYYEANPAELPQKPKKEAPQNGKGSSKRVSKQRA